LQDIQSISIFGTDISLELLQQPGEATIIRRDRRAV
jgi:hypothetical protein